MHGHLLSSVTSNQNKPKIPEYLRASGFGRGTSGGRVGIYSPRMRTRAIRTPPRRLESPVPPKKCSRHSIQSFFIMFVASSYFVFQLNFSAGSRLPCPRCSLQPVLSCTRRRLLSPIVPRSFCVSNPHKTR